MLVGRKQDPVYRSRTVLHCRLGWVRGLLPKSFLDTLLHTCFYNTVLLGPVTCSPTEEIQGIKTEFKIGLKPVPHHNFYTVLLAPEIVAVLL